MAEYVQIGVTALRAPNGEFLPSVPLFIRAEDAGEINPTTGHTVAEDLAFDDIAKEFAKTFGQYVRANQKAKREHNKKFEEAKKARHEQYRKIEEKI